MSRGRKRWAWFTEVLHALGADPLVLAAIAGVVIGCVVVLAILWPRL